MRNEGFISRNISGFTNSLELAMVTENLSKSQGLLQVLDPRIKLVTLLLFIIIVGLAQNIRILLYFLALAIALGFLSKIPLRIFLKRVFLFIPVFTLIIAIPALFTTPGNPLWQVGDKIIITAQGARTAVLLLLRVTDSLSLGMLLILTTPWVRILVALRWLRIPAVVIDILGMTYRYIFLLLHIVNSMFLARRSRTIRSFTGVENRRWLTTTLTSTLAKSQHLSESVYMAMLSRGYHGEVYLLNDFSLRRRDYLWVVFAIISASILFWVNTL